MIMLINDYEGEIATHRAVGVAWHMTIHDSRKVDEVLKEAITSEVKRQADLLESRSIVELFTLPKEVKP